MSPLSYPSIFLSFLLVLGGVNGDPIDYQSAPDTEGAATCHACVTGFVVQETPPVAHPSCHTFSSGVEERLGTPSPWDHPLNEACGSSKSAVSGPTQHQGRQIKQDTGWLAAWRTQLLSRLSAAALHPGSSRRSSSKWDLGGPRGASGSSDADPSISSNEPAGTCTQLGSCSSNPHHRPTAEQQDDDVCGDNSWDNLNFHEGRNHLPPGPGPAEFGSASGDPSKDWRCECGYGECQCQLEVQVAALVKALSGTTAAGVGGGGYGDGTNGEGTQQARDELFGGLHLSDMLGYPQLPYNPNQQEKKQGVTASRRRVSEDGSGEVDAEGGRGSGQKARSRRNKGGRKQQRADVADKEGADNNGALDPAKGGDDGSCVVRDGSVDDKKDDRDKGSACHEYHGDDAGIACMHNTSSSSSSSLVSSSQPSQPPTSTPTPPSPLLSHCYAEASNRHWFGALVSWRLPLLCALAYAAYMAFNRDRQARRGRYRREAGQRATVRRLQQAVQAIPEDGCVPPPTISVERRDTKSGKGGAAGRHGPPKPTTTLSPKGVHSSSSISTSTGTTGAKHRAATQQSPAQSPVAATTVSTPPQPTRKGRRPSGLSQSSTRQHTNPHPHQPQSQHEQQHHTTIARSLSMMSSSSAASGCSSSVSNSNGTYGATTGLSNATAPGPYARNREDSSPSEERSGGFLNTILAAGMLRALMRWTRMTRGSSSSSSIGCGVASSTVIIDDSQQDMCRSYRRDRDEEGDEERVEEKKQTTSDDGQQFTNQSSSATATVPEDRQRHTAVMNMATLAAVPNVLPSAASSQPTPAPTSSTTSQMVDYTTPERTITRLGDQPPSIALSFASFASGDVSSTDDANEATARATVAAPSTPASTARHQPSLTVTPPTSYNLTSAAAAASMTVPTLSPEHALNGTEGNATIASNVRRSGHIEAIRGPRQRLFAWTTEDNSVPHLPLEESSRPSTLPAASLYAGTALDVTEDGAVPTTLRMAEVETVSGMGSADVAVPSPPSSRLSPYPSLAGSSVAPPPPQMVAPPVYGSPTGGGIPAAASVFMTAAAIARHSYRPPVVQAALRAAVDSAVQRSGSARLLAAAGLTVRPPGSSSGCGGGKQLSASGAAISGDSKCNVKGTPPSQPPRTKEESITIGTSMTAPPSLIPASTPPSAPSPPSRCFPGSPFVTADSLLSFCGAENTPNRAATAAAGSIIPPAMSSVAAAAVPAFAAPGGDQRHQSARHAAALAALGSTMATGASVSASGHSLLTTAVPAGPRGEASSYSSAPPPLPHGLVSASRTYQALWQQRMAARGEGAGAAAGSAASSGSSGGGASVVDGVSRLKLALGLMSPPRSAAAAAAADPSLPTQRMEGEMQLIAGAQPTAIAAVGDNAATSTTTDPAPSTLPQLSAAFEAEVVAATAATATTGARRLEIGKGAAKVVAEADENGTAGESSRSRTAPNAIAPQSLGGTVSGAVRSLPAMALGEQAATSADAALRHMGGGLASPKQGGVAAGGNSGAATSGTSKGDDGGITGATSSSVSKGHVGQTVSVGSVGTLPPGLSPPPSALPVPTLASGRVYGSSTSSSSPSMSPPLALAPYALALGVAPSLTSPLPSSPLSPPSAGPPSRTSRRSSAWAASEEARRAAAQAVLAAVGATRSLSRRTTAASLPHPSVPAPPPMSSPVASTSAGTGRSTSYQALQCVPPPPPPPPRLPPPPPPPRASRITETRSVRDGGVSASATAVAIAGIIAEEASLATRPTAAADVAVSSPYGGSEDPGRAIAAATWRGGTAIHDIDVPHAAAVTDGGGDANGDDDDDGDACFVCMEGPSNLAFVHASGVVHVGVCRTCLPALTAKGWDRTCPLCRQAVTNMRVLD